MSPFTLTPLYNLDDSTEALENRQNEVKTMHEIVFSFQGFRVEAVQYSWHCILYTFMTLAVALSRLSYSQLKATSQHHSA
jgi:hypothetical protein